MLAPEVGVPPERRVCQPRVHRYHLAVRADRVDVAPQVLVHLAGHQHRRDVIHREPHELRLRGSVSVAADELVHAREIGVREVAAAVQRHRPFEVDARPRQQVVVRAPAGVVRRRLRLAQHQLVDRHAGVSVDGLLQPFDRARLAFVPVLQPLPVRAVRHIDAVPRQKRHRDQHQQHGPHAQRSPTPRRGAARRLYVRGHRRARRAARRLQVIPHDDRADERKRDPRRLPDVPRIDLVVRREPDQRARARHRKQPLLKRSRAPCPPEYVDDCGRQHGGRQQADETRVIGHLQESVVRVLRVHDEFSGVFAVLREQQPEDVRPRARQRMVREDVASHLPRVLPRRQRRTEQPARPRR